MKKLTLLSLLLFMGMSLYAQKPKPALQFEAQLDEKTEALNIVWDECLENSRVKILYAQRTLKNIALCKSNTAIDLADLMPGTYTVKLDHYTGSGERRFVKKHDGAIIWKSEMNQLDFQLFPNPGSKQLNIGSQSDLENARVSVIGLNGQILQQQQLNNSYEAIDISKLPQGMYYLRVEHSSGVGLKRFVKQ